MSQLFDGLRTLIDALDVVSLLLLEIRLPQMMRCVYEQKSKTGYATVFTDHVPSNG